MFSRLAAAAPQLQLLSLCEPCVNAALPALSASCPKLIGLCVQALHVPLSILFRLGRDLPNLTKLTLTSEQGNPGQGFRLSQYVDELLYNFGGCKRLTTLLLAPSVPTAHDTRLRLLGPAASGAAAPAARLSRCGDGIVWALDSQAALPVLAAATL